MKKRKNAVLAFLLCAAIGLGVGYAAVTKDLTIKGTVGALKDDSQFTVVFTGDVNETVNESKLTASAANGGTTASFEVQNLQTFNEKATAVYTVQNKSERFKATLSAAVYSDEACQVPWSNTYIDVDVKWSNGELAAGTGTGTITVTAELIKLPVENITNLKFHVKVTGTAVEA